jgi:septal ring factor EnvC (AmiA/AmiB activator)
VRQRVPRSRGTSDARAFCSESLDGVPGASVRSTSEGGPPIPDRERDQHGPYDFPRLQRAVEALAEAHRRLRGENAGLRRKVEEKSRRIRSLEEQMLEANQKRQDVAKRIDELVAQLDHLDAQLARTQE